MLGHSERGTPTPGVVVGLSHGAVEPRNPFSTPLELLLFCSCATFQEKLYTAKKREIMNTSREGLRTLGIATGMHWQTSLRKQELPREAFRHKE